MIRHSTYVKFLHFYTLLSLIVFYVPTHGMAKARSRSESSYWSGPSSYGNGSNYGSDSGFRTRDFHAQPSSSQSNSAPSSKSKVDNDERGYEYYERSDPFKRSEKNENWVWTSISETDTQTIVQEPAEPTQRYQPQSWSDWWNGVPKVEILEKVDESAKITQSIAESERPKIPVVNDAKKPESIPEEICAESEAVSTRAGKQLEDHLIQEQAKLNSAKYVLQTEQRDIIRANTAPPKIPANKDRKKSQSTASENCAQSATLSNPNFEKDPDEDPFKRDMLAALTYPEAYLAAATESKKALAVAVAGGSPENPAHDGLNSVESRPKQMEPIAPLEKITPMCMVAAPAIVEGLATLASNPVIPLIVGAAVQKIVDVMTPADPLQKNLLPQDATLKVDMVSPQLPEACAADKAVGGAVCVLANAFGLETQDQQMARENREYREQVALQVFQEEIRYRDSHGLRTLEEARVHMQREVQHKQLQQQMDLERQQAIQNQQIIKTFETQMKPKQFDLYVDAKSIAETELKYCMQINDAKRAREAVWKMQHIAESIAEDLVRADPKYKSICDKKDKMTASERKLINEKKVEILGQLDAYAQAATTIVQPGGACHAEQTPETKKQSEERKAKQETTAATGSPNGSPKKEDEDNKNKDKTKFSEKDKDHIFRKSDGHFPEDTPEIRKLIEDMVSDNSNFNGFDKYGTAWYSKIMENGKQVWAGVRDNAIRYAGRNEIPLPKDDVTGLLIRPQ